jgi:methyl-accepting chemotaxis protein
MKLTIKLQLRALLVFFSVLLVAMTVGVWLGLDQLRSLQDVGAVTASRAREATDAGQIGARLYRIAADAEINHDLDLSQKKWREALAEERASVTRIAGWATDPRAAALVREGSAAIDRLAKVFETEMMPALATTDGMTATIRDLDGKIDGIVDEVVTAFSGLEALAVAEAAAIDETFDALSRRYAVWAMVVMGAALLVTLLTSIRVDRAIASGVGGLQSSMKAIAEGHLDTVVGGRERTDEFGGMATTLDGMRDSLAGAERNRREQAAREEADRRLVARREALANDFVARMQTLAAGFAQSSGEVATAARSLSETAEETSRQAQAVAAAAEEASSNVETVAASSEEMAASVRSIGGQVAHSTAVADGAFREAEVSNGRISALAEAAAAIGEVVGLIKGIADQTNLLALNATIEAARAGDAGKGFAVVAAEVKQLAGQTGKATEEIGAKVGEIQQATDGTVKSMAEIVRVIGEVKQVAAAIAGAVEQQGAATVEIARNCQQAAGGAHQVTRNIAGVGQAAEMTGSASTELMSLSTGLSDQAADLRRVVETFVRDLGAA